MSFLGNIFPFIGDSIGEIASHPLQAAGAALGVPGYDPFFGGLFNNKPGGALLGPTGNFTSSAWQDMYNRNPGDAGALNQFNSINSIADKIAPAIAGGFAAPGIGAALGGAGGAGAGAAGAGAADASSAGLGAGLGGAGMGTGAGLGAGATWGGAAASPVVGSGTAGLFSSGAGAGGMTGLLGGAGAVGDAGLTGAVSAGGSGLGLMGGADMAGALGSAPTGVFSGLLPGGGMSGTASGALGGGMSGEAVGAAPIGDATMGGLGMPSSGSMLNQAQRMMQMGQQNQQQQQRQQMMMPQQPARFGNPRPQQQGPVGPMMPYASFNGSGGMPMNNPFGFGSAYGTL